MHVGSLLTAVAGWLDARRNHGRWLVRIEDIDPPREQPGASERILATLRRFGLQWDGEVLQQSMRHAAYRAALDDLRAAGVAFACTCSRRDLRGSGGIYPGTCRARTTPPSGPFAWRVRVDDVRVEVIDALQPTRHSALARDCGDFVIWRRDDLPAYQLAVVVDDAWQGVTHVVRGADLADNTARQLYLHRLLGNPPPLHAHVPVIVGRSGHKLSKQTGAPDVYPHTERAARVLLFTCLELLGLQPPDALVRAAPGTQLEWAAEHFDWAHVAQTTALSHWQGCTTARPVAGSTA